MADTNYYDFKYTPNFLVRSVEQLNDTDYKVNVRITSRIHLWSLLQAMEGKYDVLVEKLNDQIINEIPFKFTSINGGIKPNNLFMYFIVTKVPSIEELV